MDKEKRSIKTAIIILILTVVFSWNFIGLFINLIRVALYGDNINIPLAIGSTIGVIFFIFIDMNNNEISKSKRKPLSSFKDRLREAEKQSEKARDNEHP